MSWRFPPDPAVCPRRRPARPMVWRVIHREPGRWLSRGYVDHLNLPEPDAKIKVPRLSAALLGKTQSRDQDQHRRNGHRRSGDGAMPATMPRRVNELPAVNGTPAEAADSRVQVLQPQWQPGGSGVIPLAAAQSSRPARLACVSILNPVHIASFSAVFSPPMCCAVIASHATGQYSAQQDGPSPCLTPHSNAGPQQATPSLSGPDGGPEMTAIPRGYARVFSDLPSFRALLTIDFHPQGRILAPGPSDRSAGGVVDS